jgi:hypothetical protein
MSDPPEERQRWPLLSDALEICERTVNKVYQAADEEAQHYQRNHKIITALAAIFGTAAVLLAIVQLSSFVPGRWSVPSEFVAALIALFAVILGLVASFQRRYLLERHKAERYRLVKFAFLTDSDLWRANPPPRQPSSGPTEPGSRGYRHDDARCTRCLGRARRCPQHTSGEPDG